MDFDSSSKFISSLAKFLQSLCNGYVEFNNGVEVIGHIYLNVDTGKKIDYILNEKVCKTDENSVTFISNSFHAQPAEKPKPPGKHPITPDPNKLSESSIPTDEEDIIIMEEPESKNVGTIPSKDNFQRLNVSPHSKSARPSKRSYNQSFPSSHLKHSSKHNRSDPAATGPNGAQDDSLHSESNSTSNFLPSQLAGDSALTAATESDISHLSKVFPQTFNNSSDQDASEERDIKPQLDSDMKIVQVKQEYQAEQEEDQESFDDSQDQGSVFPGMPYDQYYSDGSRRGQRSDYGQSSMSQGEFFQSGAGPTGEAAAGDSSGWGSDNVLWRPDSCCPVPECKTFIARKYRRHWQEKHETTVPSWKCLTCFQCYTRPSSLIRHIKEKHEGDAHSQMSEVEYIHNDRYVDPTPLTLERILGHH